MRFYCNWLTLERRIAEVAPTLDSKKTYVVTVEEVGKTEATRRLFFAYRDRYADRIGPRDREACLEMLKEKYGPSVPYGKMAIVDGVWAFSYAKDWHTPTRPGRFVEFGSNVDRRIVFVVSTGDYSQEEYLGVIEGIKDELSANGIGYADLDGTT